MPEPWRRSADAPAINGVKNPEFQHLDAKESLAQSDKMDIGNSKYVRPDVWHFVDENIGQTPAWRMKEAPDHKFEPAKSGQGVKIVATGPSALKPSALAQKEESLAEGGEEQPPAPAPEKVSAMKPIEYQHRANTNTPNIRTTFYAQ